VRSIAVGWPPIAGVSGRETKPLLIDPTSSGVEGFAQIER
jgi:hypothetical protein